MRSRLLIFSVILAGGLTAAPAGPAPIYVDNIKGSDTYDGSRERPYASIEKACRAVKTSGRIEVVNTGIPYQMPYDGPGRHGLRRQNERCTQRQRPGSRYGCRALAAGHKAHPQSFAGEGEGGRQLQILHGSGKSDGVPVKKQYLTPLINKMLFYITKLSAIIVPTNEHAVKSVGTLKIMEANDYGFDQLPAHL